jgi:catechol 2,3-dioxygenase-like lactoylglutathione lyase family enzyme
MKSSSILLISAVISFCLLVLAGAEDARPANDAARVQLTFNHLALSVNDVDRSAEFYARVLNLSEIDRQARAKGVRWFSLGNGGQQLHLISHEYYQGGPVKINKAVHLALATDHFDEFLKQLDADGVAYGDWRGGPKQIETRSDGVKQVYFQDPDGYWIEVNDAGHK